MIDDRRSLRRGRAVRRKLRARAGDEERKESERIERQRATSIWALPLDRAERDPQGPPRRARTRREGCLLDQVAASRKGPPSRSRSKGFSLERARSHSPRAARRPRRPLGASSRLTRNIARAISNAAPRWDDSPGFGTRLPAAIAPSPRGMPEDRRKVSRSTARARRPRFATPAPQPRHFVRERARRRPAPATTAASHSLTIRKLAAPPRASTRPAGGATDRRRAERACGSTRSDPGGRFPARDVRSLHRLAHRAEPRGGASPCGRRRPLFRPRPAARGSVGAAGRSNVSAPPVESLRATGGSPS